MDEVPVLRPLALLRDAGFEVHAVTRGGPAEQAEIDGVSVSVEPTTLRVARRVAALRAELLFVESHTYGTVLGPLAHRSWVRNPMPAANPRLQRLQRAILRTYDAVSFTNPADRDSWTFSSAKHVDLAYPVDLKWWSTSVKRRDSWWTDRERASPQGPVLVTVAAYARRKRVLELLDMLAPFLVANPSSVLVLVGHQTGEPDISEQLTRRPQELGLTEQVLVTGWLSAPDIRDLLAWASVSIINSGWESQCMAIYEALAAGVPTLISALPALTSQFPTLPAHTNGPELQENLERLLANPELGPGIVASARHRLPWADVERHDEIFYEALERLLGRRTADPLVARG